MKILGIHTGHDSSAALVVDGKIVADVAEERFTRTKHYCGLPSRALDYCLKSQNLTMADIDVVAVPSEAAAVELNFLFDLKGGRRERFSPDRQAFEFVREILNKPGVKPPLYVRNYPLSARTEIVHVHHHLAHAASACYTSGTAEKQLVVTIDGIGDGVSVGLWRAEKGKIS